MVDSVLKSFEISLEALEEISSLLRKDFDKGLEREGDDVVVKMLNTYVHSLPDGTEKGKFLALDLGGSNFRVLLIGKSHLLQLPCLLLLLVSVYVLTTTAQIKDREILQLDKRLRIDDKTKQSTQQELFNFVAQVLWEFEEEHKITENLPIGFTFSFPVQQTGLISGTLIEWTKDFTAARGSGAGCHQDCWKQPWKRKGTIARDVVALVNDTTGTQMAMGIHDPDCYVGVHPGDRDKRLLPGGSEGREEAQGRKQRPHPRYNSTQSTMNRCTWVKCVHIFEKMISGRYLGEMVRLVLVQLQDDGLFLVGNASDKLRTPQVFESSYLSDIETGDSTDLSACKAIFQKLGIDGATDGDCRIVRRVCEAISTRAARLAAMGIVTILRKIGKLDRCTVAIDGTLYEKHPHFRERVAVKWWLGLDTSQGSQCAFCPAHSLDPLGHHALTCKCGGDAVLRHNALRDTLVHFLHRAHASVQVEVGAGLFPDHSQSRPADILLQNWNLGRPVALDISVVSPLNPSTLAEAGATFGAVLEATESRKHQANDEKCSALGWVSTPLAVDSYGAWGKEATLFLAQVAARLAIHKSLPKSQASFDLFSNLSICLIRANARAILRRV
eukprot:Em0475g5a